MKLVGMFQCIRCRVTWFAAWYPHKCFRTVGR